MTGLIDVGGGMRDIYGAGVMDYFLDHDVRFDVCIGVSAGSANVASFLAHQRERNYRFYTDYARRKEYMSLQHLRKSGSYFDLDYIYSVLSNEDGEDPIDYDTLSQSDSEFIVVTTDAETGDAVYFTKGEIARNDFWLLKASSAIPPACRAYQRDGKAYFDGGLADPIPLEKALELGCDKIVVIIPRPPAEKGRELSGVMKPFLKDYPAILDKFAHRPAIYNGKLKLLRRLEQEGKVILIAPDSDKGLSMVTRDREKLDAYYHKGYHDAAKAMAEFR